MATNREIAVAVLIGVIAGALLPWGDDYSDEPSISPGRSTERLTAESPRSQRLNSNVDAVRSR